MKVLIASDVRIAEKFGRYYARSQHYTIFERYYEAFGRLEICCRVVALNGDAAEWWDITAWVNQVIPIGSLGRLFLRNNNPKIKTALQSCDMAICRCPSISACYVADCARRIDKPYLVEVMGCAWDAYWNHGITGKLIAPYMFFKTKQAVRNADYALYVTNSFLQNRYPCKNESVGVSNVRIDSVDSQVLEKRLEKIRSAVPGVISLMTAAAVDVRYKGQEYVIRAIPLLNRAGIRVKYTLVGGGSQDYLRQIAEKCGVSDQVFFAGRMPIEEVFTQLDQTDIYIQPSLQEGLPRSVIEAMSRGCPVIGARTAGIPELIPEECVVSRKSVKDIVKTVVAIWNEKELKRLANRNFDVSKQYLDEMLTRRRKAYFEDIKKELNTK